MNSETTVFDEYILENTISDFAEYLESHLGIKNLNENEIDSKELKYKIDGKPLIISVTFEADLESNQHPVNQMNITMEFPDLSFEPMIKQIYQLFEVFKAAINLTVKPEDVWPERPGLPIGKVHFEVIQIDPKVKFGRYMANEGNYQYDFKFKDLEEAQAFYIAVVQDAINAGTFHTKAITEIGNEILKHF